MGRTRDPYVITVKYAAKCAQTGRPLAKGDRAVYYPSAERGKNLFHMESDQAMEFNRWKQDMAMGNDY